MALARQVGFTFSLNDADRVVDMPFGLFSKGEKRGVELVITGEHDGLPMRMFDYWYYDETSDSQGNRSRTYHRFTCGDRDDSGRVSPSSARARELHDAARRSPRTARRRSSSTTISTVASG